MSLVCFKSFAGILLNVVGLFLSRRLISALISSSLVVENENFSITFSFSIILIMMGCSLNSKRAFNMGSNDLILEVLSVEYPFIFNLFTALLKKSFIVSATSLFFEIISSFSIRIILLAHWFFFEKRGVTVFQNFLLSVISFGSKFSYFFFSFLNKLTL